MLEKKVNILLLTLLTLVSTAVSAAVNTQYTATVCGSGSYLFGCETLSSGGPAQNVLGDSTVHLNLLFAAPKATEYTATIEPGQTYLFGCDQYSVDGSTASQTLQQAGCGCDSTVTFKLRVQAPVPAPEDITVSYEAQIQSGETYLFGCDLLTEANTYSRTISRVNGGDSIINLTLSYMTIPGTEPIEVSYTAQINEGEKYLFGCQILDAEGSYTNTLKRTNGADSIVNLTLSFATAPVVEPIEVSYTAEINEGEKYLFGCQILDAEGSYTNTLKRTNGADSIVNLTLSFASAPVVEPIEVSYTAEINEGEKYLFGCQILDAEGSYTNTLKRTNGADSIVNLTLSFATAPVVEPIEVSYTAEINEGEKYLFGCQILDAEGSYTNTLKRTNGADSIVNLTLSFATAPVVEPIEVSYTAEINEGEKYLFGCQILDAEGSYTNTLKRTNGADSIVNLTLSFATAPVVEPIEVSYTAEINEGEKYLFGCQILDAEGSYTNTLKRTNGADSIVNLTLSFATAPVVEPIEVSYTAEINEGEKYLFGCQILDAEGSYQNTLKRTNGADSIVNLTLSFASAPVVEPIEVSYTAEINEGEKYLFGCQILDAEGSYTNTLKRANGADSIVNLTLSFVTVPEPEDIEVSYEAEIVGGEIYLFGCNPLTTAGNYTNTLKRENGGDSIINLTLKVLSYGDTIAADCDPIVWYEHTCDATGDYDHTFVGGNIYGGDSIVTLHFTLLQPTYGDTVAAEFAPITWYEHTCDATGDYDHVFVGGNSQGCDSILTLHFTLLTIPETYGDTVAADCDPIVWYEHTCDATGDYDHVFVGGNAAGGDSILTLHFTLLEPTYGDTVAAEKEPITWYEHTCDATNDYVHVFVGGNSQGCDSILTLHFTLLATTYGDTIAAECDVFTWYEHTCAATGDYVHTFVGGNAAGGDSIVTLHFTLLEPTYGDTIASDCAAFAWYEHTCAATGDFVHTFVGGNAAGCDSIVTLHFTLLEPAYGDTTVNDACDSFEWNGTTYTESGDYTFKTTSVVTGCDSIVTLHLTLHKSAEKTADAVTQCYSYYWAYADSTIYDSGTYKHTEPTIHGCDSTVTITVTINSPYVDTLEVRGYYGDRIIMVNRKQINSIPGWTVELDSLDNGKGYVTWYKMSGATPNPAADEKVATGYYYTLETGEPLPAGQYYAVVDIPASDGAPCGAQGITEVYPVAGAAPAPALMPSLARPGEDIKVINLDPKAETVIRIYSAEGVLQRTFTARDAETFVFKAEYGNGFYLVELSSDSMKSTLRYIVK